MFFFPLPNEITLGQFRRNNDNVFVVCKRVDSDFDATQLLAVSVDTADA
jgi:hypothetical protein